MQNIKKIYLYLVSLVSLFIIVFGAISLLNMGLKTWVFTKADKDFYSYPMCQTEVSPDPTGNSVAYKCDEAEQQRRAEDAREAQKQRDAANSLAMIIVGAPVFYFHWRLARKEV